MGFESYNFNLKTLSSIDKIQIVNSFIKMGYSICEDDTLEKALKSGFIEVQVGQGYISIRTAKTNDESIIVEIIKDMNVLNDEIQIDAFDLQLKQKISLEQHQEVISNFKLLHNEFKTYYPNTKSPIRCNDIYREQGV